MSHKKAAEHNKRNDAHGIVVQPAKEHAEDEHKSVQGTERSISEPEALDTSISEAELKAALEKKDVENKELYDRLLRSMADFDNHKKRVSKEKDDLIRYGNEKLVREFLPVIDNFERALGQAENAPASQALKEGIEMILKQFISVLEKFGVKSFSSIGQSFDPNKHEAMVQQESAEHENNTVISEFQKGYYLHDRLLRPALVAVAKSPSVQEDSAALPDTTDH